MGGGKGRQRRAEPESPQSPRRTWKRQPPAGRAGGAAAALTRLVGSATTASTSGRAGRPLGCCRGGQEGCWGAVLEDGLQPHQTSRAHALFETVHLGSWEDQTKKSSPHASPTFLRHRQASLNSQPTA